jgi:type I restriction enzyme S subunit
MADPGKSAIIEEQVDAVFASYLVRLKTCSLATACYVYGFLKSQAYEEYSQGALSGSVQANMNAKVIVAADLVIPPTKLNDAYAARVLPLRRLIVGNLREASTLAAIRDTLLPKLISGEIRLREVDQICERGL